MSQSVRTLPARPMSASVGGQREFKIKSTRPIAPKKQPKVLFEDEVVMNGKLYFVTFRE